MQLAKPYGTVQGRQHFEAEPMRRPAELAPCARQIFMAPSGGANNLWRSPRGGRSCWRHAPGKSLWHRSGAPTICGGACEAAGRVGAMRLAKPYGTASGRQQFEAEPERRPAELAPCARQSLMAPSGGANNMRRSPRGGRPSWRHAPGKALWHRPGEPTI